MSSPTDLLRQWIWRQADDAQKSWIEAQDSKLPEANSDQAFYMAISLIPRKLGKADLGLNTDDLADAQNARKGWDPSDWSLDQAGRLYMLLAHGGAGTQFSNRLTQLMATADVAEEITFLRGLPLFPDQAAHEAIARKGCRTNMQPVFEAVAHKTPYPQEQFDENAWNHLVLKALFVGSTLYPIQGFDQRANPELARIMCDYAHERWAAKRAITPEIWRGVGPFAKGSMIDDLIKVASSSDKIESFAGIMALRASKDPSAAKALTSISSDIPSGVTWNNLLQFDG